MKKTYPIYVAMVLGIFYITVFIVQGNVLSFIDPASFMIVHIPLLLILLTSYSPSEMIQSFKTAMHFNQSSLTELKTAYLLFDTALVLLYKIAVLATLFGVIVMIASTLEWTAEHFALGFSVAILSVVYALFTGVLVIIPFKMAIKKKMNVILSK